MNKEKQEQEYTIDMSKSENCYISGNFTIETMEDSTLRLLKKYIKVLGEGDNRTLVFKGVSSKRNKEDFERIVRFVEGK